MSGILPYLVNSLLYALLALYLWRSHGWYATRPPAAALSETAKSFERYAVLVPLSLHTFLLYRSVFAAGGLYLGVGTAVSLIIWLTVLIYWISNFFYKLDGLQALVIPVAAICSLLPAVFPSLRPLPHSEMAAFKLHLLIAMLAYSLFTIASLHVLLMTLLERGLHQDPLSPLLKDLPPLLTMETLLFRIITTGFVLLTLTLASGIFFSEALFGKPLRLHHKTIFALLSWLIFAALLGGRKFYGWRGRVAVRWTLAGFLSLVLAYIGSKFVLEVVLGRG